MSEMPASGAFCMRRIIVALSGVALLLALAACGGGSSRSVPSGAVAVVGNSSIPKSAYDGLIAQTQRNYQATHHAFPKPGTVALATLRANATQFLISASEYQQEAKKLGVTITSKDIEDRLKQIKLQIAGSRPGQGTPTAKQIEQRYQAALKAQGFTDSEVHDGIRISLLRERVQAKVTHDVTVSDSEIKDYYDKHKLTYQIPAQPATRNVRHILVKTKKLADRLYARLSAKPSLFPKLAKQYSQDKSSGIAGGVLPGGAVKGRLLKPFEQVAFSIQTNVISKPVHTSVGWHIIEALGPVKAPAPAHEAPLSQVKEAIRQILLQNKRNQVLSSWTQKTVNHYCGTIAYQAGYAPASGQDPCKRPQGTTASTT
ncbi:MAG: peptidylprolyl isomerase [Gaiellaceae bacterium]